MLTGVERQEFLLRIQGVCEIEPQIFHEVMQYASSGIIKSQKEALEYGVDMEVIAFNTLNKPSADFIEERLEKHSSKLRFTKESWSNLIERELKSIQEVSDESR